MMPPCNGRPFFIAVAEAIANEYPCGGDQKCRRTDDGDGEPNVDAQKCKRDADSQRVNTGGDGHQQ